MGYKDADKQREFQRKWIAAKIKKETPDAKAKRLKAHRKCNINYAKSDRGQITELVYDAVYRCRGAGGPRKDRRRSLLNKDRVFKSISFELSPYKNWRLFLMNYRKRPRTYQNELINDLARLLIFLQKDTKNEFATNPDKQNKTR